MSLTFVPLLLEPLLIGGVCNFVLGMPITWSIMTGFGLSASAAALVVPHMIKLKQQQLGTSRGIPTMVMASCSMDVVLGITAFSVMFGFVFNDQSTSVVAQIGQGIGEVVAGIAIGFIGGQLIPRLTLSRCPTLKPLAIEVEKPISYEFSAFVLHAAAIALVLVTRAIGFAGCGPLAALMLGLSSAPLYQKHHPDVQKQVDSRLKTIWTLTEPFMFGLVGAEVSVDQLVSSQTYVIVGVILTDCLIRVIINFGALSFSELNFKEKLYVA